DVIEFLSDTGLGKEMHSVISQGRVDAIVTSKPRDRRLLIEEAAGLGKHRKRRRRAQLKLERTQENLDRALDVEREARARLRPLKRQAEAAALHERLALQSDQARWELARDDVRLRTERRPAAEAAAAAAPAAAASGSPSSRPSSSCCGASGRPGSSGSWPRSPTSGPRPGSGWPRCRRPGPSSSPPPPRLSRRSSERGPTSGGESLRSRRP